MPAKGTFLSDASEDRDRIGPLIRAREDAGWTVFSSPWGLTEPAAKRVALTCPAQRLTFLAAAALGPCGGIPEADQLIAADPDQVASDCANRQADETARRN